MLFLLIKNIYDNKRKQLITLLKNFNALIMQCISMKSIIIKLVIIYRYVNKDIYLEGRL